jgi:hypothetical protein
MRLDNILLVRIRSSIYNNRLYLKLQIFIYFFGIILTASPNWWTASPNWWTASPNLIMNSFILRLFIISALFSIICWWIYFDFLYFSFFLLLVRFWPVITFLNYRFWIIELSFKIFFFFSPYFFRALLWKT